MKKKRLPENLICYKESRTQKWIMTDRDNDDEVIMNLLLNEKVDKHSIFIIPVCGVPFGAIWLWTKTHGKSKCNLYNFFEEYNIKQPNIEQYEEAKQIADECKEERYEKQHSKYGFISPSGEYYSCQFEGHHHLAYEICFGQFETNNPERCLEEHGWCKIYRPLGSRQYDIYLANNYILTEAQFKVLQSLGLDNCRSISEFLV